MVNVIDSKIDLDQISYKFLTRNFLKRSISYFEIDILEMFMYDVTVTKHVFVVSAFAYLRNWIYFKLNLISSNWNVFFLKFRFEYG